MFKKPTSPDFAMQAKALLSDAITVARHRVADAEMEKFAQTLVTHGAAGIYFPDLVEKIETLHSLGYVASGDFERMLATALRQRHEADTLAADQCKKEQATKARREAEQAKADLAAAQKRVAELAGAR